MKKRILKIAPYFAGLIYLVYCLMNINYWVKSHSGYELFVLIPWLSALVISVLLIWLRISEKKKVNFWHASVY